MWPRAARKKPAGARQRLMLLVGVFCHTPHHTHGHGRAKRGLAGGGHTQMGEEEKETPNGQDLGKEEGEEEEEVVTVTVTAAVRVGDVAQRKDGAVHGASSYPGKGSTLKLNINTANSPVIGSWPTCMQASSCVAC